MNNNKWWEKTAKKVYDQHYYLPTSPKQLGRIVFWYTHGQKYADVARAFWIGPNGEVEIVERHILSEDVDKRTLQSGWIRGRVSKIPREYFIKNNPDTNIGDFKDIQIWNIYAHNIEDFANNIDIMKQFVSALDTISQMAGVTIHYDSVVSITKYRTSSIIGTLDDIRQASTGTGYISPPKELKVQKKSEKNIECDACHDRVDKSTITVFNGPKIYGNICFNCVAKATEDNRQ